MGGPSVCTTPVRWSSGSRSSSGRGSSPPSLPALCSRLLLAGARRYNRPATAVLAGSWAGGPWALWYGRNGATRGVVPSRSQSACAPGALRCCCAAPRWPASSQHGACSSPRICPRFVAAADRRSPIAEALSWTRGLRGSRASPRMQRDRAPRRDHNGAASIRASASPPPRVRAAGWLQRKKEKKKKKKKMRDSFVCSTRSPSKIGGALLLSWHRMLVGRR